MNNFDLISQRIQSVIKRNRCLVKCLLHLLRVIGGQGDGGRDTLRSPLARSAHGINSVDRPVDLFPIEPRAWKWPHDDSLSKVELQGRIPEDDEAIEPVELVSPGPRLFTGSGTGPIISAQPRFRSRLDGRAQVNSRGLTC